MAATKLGKLPTCDTPYETTVDSDGWMHRVHTCGCSKTYGRYQGIGCRPLLSTTVCDAQVETCEKCGYQTYPYSDCVCHLVEE